MHHSYVTLLCPPQDLDNYIFLHANHFDISGLDIVIRLISREMLINLSTFLGIVFFKLLQFLEFQ